MVFLRCLSGAVARNTIRSRGRKSMISVRRLAWWDLRGWLSPGRRLWGRGFDRQGGIVGWMPCNESSLDQCRLNCAGHRECDLSGMQACFLESASTVQHDTRRRKRSVLGKSLQPEGEAN
eukprot:2121357-Pyramimonas_sp.AAC.3